MQDFLRLLHYLPHAYLVLSRDLTIVDANPAYCELSLTDLDLIRGRNMFDAFPDNPGDPEANGVRNLRTSLKIVLVRSAKTACVGSAMISGTGVGSFKSVTGHQSTRLFMTTTATCA